jgi:hypothetical protein
MRAPMLDRITHIAFDPESAKALRHFEYASEPRWLADSGPEWAGGVLLDAEDGGLLETRRVGIAATNNNYLNFAGLHKPPCKFSSRHSLCARLFFVRLVRTYFLLPDQYKQAINTTKGAVFLLHCRRSSSVTVMGRTETSIDLLLLFAPISQSSSCIGGRGRAIS